MSTAFTIFTCPRHLYVNGLYMSTAFTCPRPLNVYGIYMSAVFTCLWHLLHVHCIYMSTEFTCLRHLHVNGIYMSTEFTSPRHLQQRNYVNAFHDFLVQLFYTISAEHRRINWRYKHISQLTLGTDIPVSYEKYIPIKNIYARDK